MMSRTSYHSFGVFFFATDLHLHSKIKYSFAAELRDIALNGFVLPPDQIRPSGEEIWAGVKYLLEKIK